MKIDLKEIRLIDGISEVTSEKEYWDKHKEYNKKIKKLSRDFKLLIYYPEDYIKKFEILLCEMVSYGLVSLEWANSKRKKLYDDLKNPVKYKGWVIKKLEKIRDKQLKKKK